MVAEGAIVDLELMATPTISEYEENLKDGEICISIAQYQWQGLELWCGWTLLTSKGDSLGPGLQHTEDVETYEKVGMYEAPVRPHEFGYSRVGIIVSGRSEQGSDQ